MPKARVGRPVPIHAYESGSAEDPMLVFNLTDQVRETIQQTLDRLRTKRRTMFLG